jgi:CheY-like chemotaxis protein
VAEDEVAVLVTCRESLETEGVRVVQYDPGRVAIALEEAVQMLQRFEQEPHTGFLDHPEDVDRLRRVKT